MDHKEGFKQENLSRISTAERGKKIKRPEDLMITERIQKNKQNHLQLYQGKRNTRERMAHQ